jgi:hypothetical protein
LDVPYAQRRELLEGLDLGLGGGSWQMPPSFTGYMDGDVLAVSRDHGLKASWPSGWTRRTSRADAHQTGARSRTSTARSSSSAAGDPRTWPDRPDRLPAGRRAGPWRPAVHRPRRHRLHPSNAAAARKQAGFPAPAREPVREGAAPRACPRGSLGAAAAGHRRRLRRLDRLSGRECSTSRRWTRWAGSSSYREQVCSQPGHCSARPEPVKSAYGVGSADLRFLTSPARRLAGAITQ